MLIRKVIKYDTYHNREQTRWNFCGKKQETSVY